MVCRDHTSYDVKVASYNHKFYLFNDRPCIQYDIFTYIINIHDLAILSTFHGLTVNSRVSPIYGGREGPRILLS